MLSLALFLLSVMSFSVFSAWKLHKKFEETIGIGFMGIILFLFLCGMINVLLPGAIILFIATLGVYVYVIVEIVRIRDRDTISAKFKNIFTPGFFVFIVLTIVLVYVEKGRLVVLCDELSHWADTVKIMSLINHFGTAKDAGATFASYPPAMSLIQYYSQKIFQFLGGQGFCEWRIYFAYKLFAVALMMPLIGGLFTSDNKLLANSEDSNLLFSKVMVLLIKLISFIPGLILPLYLFKEYYASAYIDPFLSIVAGCAFAAVILWRKRDWNYYIYISLACFTLTIAKDVGILLAVFVAVLYVLDVLFSDNEAKNKVQKCVMTVMPIAFILIGKLLWKIEIAVSHTGVKFSKPFQVKTLVDVLLGKDDTYCSIVYQNYLEMMRYHYIHFGNMGFNYISLIVCTITLLMIGVYILKSKGIINNITCVAGIVMPSVTLIGYTVGLLPLYISRFSQEEAIALASFDRYLGIVLLAVLYVGYFIIRAYALYVVESVETKKISFTILALILASVFCMIHANYDAIVLLISRHSIKNTLTTREYIDPLSKQIEEVWDGDDNFYVVMANDDGTWEAMLEFAIHPIEVDAFYDLEGNYADYDYVALFTVEDDFVDKYANLFESPESIGPNHLYQVQDGMLVRVQ